MKYSEYQVWFHAFNNAVLGLTQQETIKIDSIIPIAEKIAEFALQKFNTVDQPQTPDLSSFGDMKTIVEDVVKKAAQGQVK